MSTRKVTEVMRERCGLEVSSTQVSRATRLLDEELGQRRNRPLSEVPYVFLDARYEKIRHGGSVVSRAVLMAFGVDESGHRTVPGNGNPRWSEGKLAELERKIGQQTLEIDFLKACLQRIEEQRMWQALTGNPLSSRKSGKK